jgi:hypothetical protein
MTPEQRAKQLCQSFDIWFDNLKENEKDALMDHLEENYSLVHESRVQEVARSMS